MDWEKGRESDNVVEDEAAAAVVAGWAACSSEASISDWAAPRHRRRQPVIRQNPLQVLSMLSGGDSGAPPCNRCRLGAKAGRRQKPTNRTVSCERSLAAPKMSGPSISRLVTSGTSAQR